jgi:hypothetical protein
MRANALIQALAPAHEEIYRRSVRTTKLKVVDGPARAGGTKRTLAAPGSITVLFARQGSRALKTLQQAAKDGGDAVQNVFEQVERQIAGRKQVSIEEAVKAMCREPVFAELRYGGATLVPHLFLTNGLDVGGVVMPYNGGALAREGFQWVEHVKDDLKAGLEAVVIKSNPPLTAAEKAALRLLPPDQRSLNVGTVLGCDTTGTAVAWVAAVVVLLLVALATSGCAAVTDKHIAEEVLKKLGPLASAREILRVRREMLMKAGGG